MHSMEQQIFSGEIFEKVRSSSLLKDKSLLANGTFSLVFEGSTPASIYHLALDNAGHDFSMKAKRYSIDGVRKIFRDFGAIAIYQHDPFYPDYLWLAELEVLNPLVSSPAAHHEVQDVLRCLTGRPEGKIYSTFTGKCELLSNLNRTPIYARTARCVQALRKLMLKYVTSSSCDFDLRIENFMIRPYTGEVVLDGPINWICDVEPEHHLRLSQVDVFIEGDTTFRSSAQILHFDRARMGR